MCVYGLVQAQCKVPKTDLQIGIEILSGRRAQKYSSLSDDEAFSDKLSDISDSDGSENPNASPEEEEEPVSELSQLLLAVMEAISSLYKLAVATRNPTPRDRYAKAASLAPFDASFDVDHVYEEFPYLRSKAWLAERLGKAITKRRELLRYRSQHRDKVGGGIRSPFDLSKGHELADAPGKVASNDAQINMGASVPGFEAESVGYSQLASTQTATHAASSDDKDSDLGSTASESETSFGTEDNLNSMRQVQEPPKESANGRPFECPYCFVILTIKNINLWK